ncbi:MAG: F0F1 ATP synthase subunit gamma [Oscillospiraceae bacterium]
MASMKDIKTRIRSVESTQQITRAMELVATSKLRHARERVERSRPFHEVLGEAIAGIQAGLKETPSVYSEVRPVKKTCFVVIGGDRGLAGGYNANLHRLVLSLAGSELLLRAAHRQKAARAVHPQRRGDSSAPISALPPPSASATACRSPACCATALQPGAMTA